MFLVTAIMAYLKESHQKNLQETADSIRNSKEAAFYSKSMLIVLRFAILSGMIDEYLKKSWHWPPNSLEKLCPEYGPVLKAWCSLNQIV